MKKIIPFVSVFIIGLSCTQNEIDCIRPYTQKELRFISDFSTKGLKVELDRFNYSYSGDSMDVCARYLTDSYVIRIENESMNAILDIDSMQLRTREVASKFYREIIEDSILIYTSEVVVHISTKTLTKKLNPKDAKSASYTSSSYYEATFRKEDLESYCGFQVIEHNNKTIRKKVERTALLPLFSEIKSN